MDKILITDAAGYIGSEIVRQLYEEGNWDISVLDSMPEFWNINRHFISQMV